MSGEYGLGELLGISARYCGQEDDVYTVDLGSIDSAGQEPYVSWLEVPPKNTFYVQEVTCGKLLHVPDAPKYESSREDKMTTPNCTFIDDTYSLVYEELKYLHECTHCGFEATFYEAEYKCPICKIGTLCRTARNITVEWPGFTEGPDDGVDRI